MSTGNASAHRGRGGTVIHIRRRAPPSVEHRWPEPVGSAALRIDHRQTSGRGRDARRRKPGREVTVSCRKRLVDQFQVRPRSNLVLGRAKDEQGRSDGSWAPAHSAGGTPCFPLIPSQGSLDPTEIIDLGLDLAAKQATVRGPVGEDIDPPAVAACSDLDFLAYLPAQCRDTPRNMAAAPRVDEIALLAPVLEPKGRTVKAQPNAHQFERGRCELDVQVSQSSDFEPLDRRLARAESNGKLALTPARRLARQPDARTDPQPDVIRGNEPTGHALWIADDASLAFHRAFVAP